MNLVVTKRYERPSKELFLLSVIEKVIRVNLPCVTSNYKDLIYSIQLKGNTLRLDCFVLGDKVKINPTQLWEEGKLVIAKCLPKFTSSCAYKHKDIIDIITTNSNSFIWLCDVIIDEKIQNEIWLESDKPIFNMVFDDLDNTSLNTSFDEEILNNFGIHNTSISNISQVDGQYSIES